METGYWTGIGQAIRRHGRAIIVAGALLLALMAGGASAWTYGWPGDTLNGGIRVDAPLGLGCLGLEVWGSPGFFGGLDAGSCDI